MRRIRTRTQFQAVMGAGSVAAKTPHFALHVAPLPPQPAPTPLCTHSHAPAASPDKAARPLFDGVDTWLGVVLPKRWARRAVTRNAIRRQIYETARLNIGVLPHAALVVRLRSEFDRQRFVSASSVALKHAVRGELVQLWSRAPNGVGPAALASQAPSR